nr:AAA domain-containing protein [Ruthenibacterium lactatiformans]
MEARKHLIIIKGRDQTDSVTSFQFHDGKCEVIYTNAPNKTYSFQSSNVEILPLQKIIDPTQVIVTANGQTISGIDELLDFERYYRIVRSGKKDLSFRKSEVQLQQNCLTDGKNQETFQYFKETAAVISLVAENGLNILSMQYDKIKQVSEDTVLASYLAPQKDIKAPRMPEMVIYPFGLNQSQKLAVERALSSKISIIQGPPGTGKTQTILNIIANIVRSGKTVAVTSNNNSATRNVAEKLEKKNAAFLTAFLGSLANKQKFLEAQTSTYPDMSDWEMPLEEQRQLEQEATVLSKELNEMLNAKNRIAEIEQEFLQLNPEQHYFKEYFATYSDAPTESLDKLSSQKILALWMEFEQHVEHESRLGLLQKLSIMFRFNRNALKLFLRSPDLVIPYLQSQFYTVKRRELESEKQELSRKLEHYAFDAKMGELTQKSLRLFRAEFAARYHWKSGRRRFEKNDFRWHSAEFTREYPVVLSTTYSIKGTLSMDHIYDYLIVDEASQVDLATGVLAFSCARNVVIVGDLKQLPNVLTEGDIRTSDAIWQKYSMDERYRFSTHSLLSSALEIWQDAPVTLLREHYRCHPKIINFCNQKFYHGQLIVMTKDHNEPDVLTMYRTTAGNHARGHLNQRQIDVIQKEVLPRLHQKNFQSIGIITPYRDQVAAIRKQLSDAYEVDTVHKFQGREQDAIILTSVDNVITDFVDDPHMLNVAVSRAVHSLSVVTSQDPRNDHTNYGDLTRYIEYNNFEVIQSQVYSVFDMLYHGYAEQRRAYLQKHKRVSEYDSENLMYSVIQEVLSEEVFSTIGCAVHVSLATLVKDYGPLTDEEREYARNPLTHVDFLLFNRMDKQPVLVIEVDGTGFHGVGSKQAERDKKKNSILEKCGLPLLRLRTDGSGEKEKIETALKKK